MAGKVTVRVRDTGDLFQRDTKAAIDNLASSPLLQGRAVEDVTLSGAARKVYHNLGRPAVGWLVTYTETPCAVFKGGNNTNEYIELGAVTHDIALGVPALIPAPLEVTVNLWIF